MTHSEHIKALELELTSNGNVVVAKGSLYIGNMSDASRSLPRWPCVKFTHHTFGNTVRHYVGGKMPYLARPNKTCFREECVRSGTRSDVDQFIAMFNQKTPEWFLLTPWTDKDAIDAGEALPYTRIGMEFCAYGLDNYSMERGLLRGTVKDVSACDKTPDGDFILDGSLKDEAESRRGFGFCDPTIERWICSVGRHKDTGVVIASLSGKLRNNSAYTSLAVM